MTKQVHLYVLLDPRVADVIQRVRYIGMTKRTLKQRLNQHVCEAKKTDGCHRLHWIRELLSAELKPEIALVSTVAASDASAAESALIAEYRAQGCPLTNNTTGGNGNYELSPEARAKISAVARNRSLETRELIRQAHLGRTHTPETRKKLSEAWQHYDAATRQRIIAAVKRVNTGNTYSAGRELSQATREQMSLARKGKPNLHWLGRKHTPETRAKLRAASKHTSGMLGKHHSEETKQKLAAALRGRPGHILSEDARLKISIAQRGEARQNAKLTWDKAREIRTLYAAGAAEQADLARRFGVSQATISYVINGRKWVEPDQH